MTIKFSSQAGIAACLALCACLLACVSPECAADRRRRYDHYTELMRAFPARGTRSQLYAMFPPLSKPALPTDTMGIGTGVVGTEFYPIDADFEIVVFFGYKHYISGSPDDIIIDIDEIRTRSVPAPGPNQALQRTEAGGGVVPRSGLDLASLCR